MTALADFELADIHSGENLVAQARGKAVLLVNVASECGFTPQYEALQSLHDELADKGFTVIGVPCNQFGAQEPGSEEEIVSFCTSRYSVSFPMSKKTEVNGANRHPLYAWLTDPAQGFPGDIAWNFEKFLIDHRGLPVGRYPSGVTPRDNGLMQDIAEALPG
ncbi:MAG: glutathione peroxidase [Gammaproteobacteria bacterium]|nr:glutathione peroxidase [Gammaproteobacteria bacterium]